MDYALRGSHDSWGPLISCLLIWVYFCCFSKPLVKSCFIILALSQVCYRELRRVLSPLESNLWKSTSDPGDKGGSSNDVWQYSKEKMNLERTEIWLSICLSFSCRDSTSIPVLEAFIKRDCGVSYNFPHRLLGQVNPSWSNCEINPIFLNFQGLNMISQKEHNLWSWKTWVHSHPGRGL